MPAIHLAVEELGCKVFEVQHASRDHSEGVARLGEVDALLVLEYGQVAWSQELTECLVQARRKLPTCLRPDRSQCSSVLDSSGGLEDSWSCLPYWVGVTLMLSKYPKSQIMMINGTNTGTGLSIAFVSLLMFIYTQQFANVMWGNSEVKP